MKLNKYMAIGNLTRDPQVRPAGESNVVNFGLAVNGWRDGDTLFIDCEAWNKTGEVVQLYCLKGSEVYVEGRLKLDQWKDRDGNARQRIKVVVERVSLGRNTDAIDTRQKGDGPAEAINTQSAGEDDIPF